MAMSTCDKCGFEVDAWDDGNPYVQDSKGKRHYFYHPTNEWDIMLRKGVRQRNGACDQRKPHYF